MTITTKIGFGGRVSGQIRVASYLDADLAGKIVVILSPVGREFLEKAGLVGVAGIVVPSIHFRDYEYVRQLNEFPLLVLLKFGRLELAKELREKMEKLDGEKGILNGEEKTLVV